MAKKDHPAAGGRDDLLRPAPRRYTTCYVPELDRTFRLRSLNERERAEYETALDDGTGDVDPMRAKTQLVVRVLVDDNGDRLLTDGDADRLLDQDHAIVGRLHAMALRHCNFEPGDDPGELRRCSQRIPGAEQR